MEWSDLVYQLYNKWLPLYNYESLASVQHTKMAHQGGHGVELKIKKVEIVSNRIATIPKLKCHGHLG